ncbi:MAG TPA: VOC family protein [Mycobacteriales bacterium]|nr:VOC family protein [Mycobacteriales bacterium]
MRIDHVLYGVRDLPEAQRWFSDEFGLAAASGGAHPELGTANAIISAGPGQYVELIAVVDATINHPLPKVLNAMLTDGDRPVGMCLRPDDLEQVAERLALSPVDMHRDPPGGRRIEWRVVGMEGALGPHRLPFFIDWGSHAAELDTENESAAPDGAIAWVEIGAAPDDLARWVGEPVDGLRAVDAPPGVSRFAIRRGDSEIVIGPREIR